VNGQDGVCFDEILAEQDRTLGLLVRNARAVRCNHSLRYLAYVAEDVYDAFVYHSLGLWDLLGQSVILAEAGAAVCSLDGTPVDLTPDVNSSNRIITAMGANPALLARLVELLK